MKPQAPTQKPTLETIQPFIVKGFQIRTKLEQELDPATAKIGPLWQEFFGSPLFGQGVPMGIYYNYESNENGEYDVMAGIAGEDEALTQIEIGSGRYLCFKFEGEMPTACIQGWMYVWDYFQQADCGYERMYVTDFEKYTSESSVEIYIGVK